ncbi:TPA: hypothetical protein HA238_04940 [Candidatus Micrarchaeota archaeon]|nr:hypothetical protein [Candidatus Micrarchaeota archaeon]
MKILVFGNKLVKKDSLALSVADALAGTLRNRGVEFKEFDTAENLEDEGPNITILDVASGIKKVTVFEESDLGKFEKSPIYSMHDFDLEITLKLLKKIGKIKTVGIIAIPMDYEKKKAMDEVMAIINNKLTSKANLF